MKKLAEFLVKSLADRPEGASVQDSESDGAVTLKLVVAEEDKGKIIGKKGKVIKAIRSLVSAAGAKEQKTVVVDID
jgi:hypothetical protein